MCRTERNGVNVHDNERGRGIADGRAQRERERERCCARQGSGHIHMFAMVR